MVDPLERHCSHTHFPAEFDHVRSNDTGVKDICLKILTLHISISPFKVIGTDWVRSVTYDFREFLLGLIHTISI